MIATALPLVSIILAAVLYLRGCMRRPGSVHPMRVAAFYGGLVAVALALFGRVGELSEVTFSGHMIQHVILMSLAAPLVVAGDAGRVLRLGAPRSLVRALGRLPGRRAMRNGLTVTVAFVVVLWTWHLPDLYEAAIRNYVVHGIEHASFFAAALLLWSVAFGRRRASEPVALLVVFLTSLAGAALGAVITFAGTVLYPIHAVRAPSIGLDALVDQQLAGAIMWVPPGVVSLTVMVLLVARLLARSADPAPVGGDA